MKWKRIVLVATLVIVVLLLVVFRSTWGPYRQLAVGKDPDHLNSVLEFLVDAKIDHKVSGDKILVKREDWSYVDSILSNMTGKVFSITTYTDQVDDKKQQMNMAKSKAIEKALVEGLDVVEMANVALTAYGVEGGSRLVAVLDLNGTLSNDQIEKMVNFLKNSVPNLVDENIKIFDMEGGKLN